MLKELFHFFTGWRFYAIIDAITPKIEILRFAFQSNFPGFRCPGPQIEVFIDFYNEKNRFYRKLGMDRDNSYKWYQEAGSAFISLSRFSALGKTGFSKTCEFFRGFSELIFRPGSNGSSLSPFQL